jgi:hypothetical protein
MKDLDFLPASFHAARRRRRQRRRNILYVATVIVSLVGLHGINEIRIRAAEASLARLDAASTSLDPKRQQLAGLRARHQVLDHRMTLISRLDDDAPINAVLAEITRYMNEAMALRSVSIESTVPKAPKGGSADPVLDRGPTRVVLQGVAAHDVQIGQFWGQLRQSPLFAEVELSYTRKTQEQGRQMREFELACTLKRVTLKSRALREFENSDLQ